MKRTIFAVATAMLLLIGATYLLDRPTTSASTYARMATQRVAPSGAQGFVLVSAPIDVPSKSTYELTATVSGSISGSQQYPVLFVVHVYSQSGAKIYTSTTGVVSGEFGSATMLGDPTLTSGHYQIDVEAYTMAGTTFKVIDGAVRMTTN
jgi:hypothetical protein